MRVRHRYPLEAAPRPHGRDSLVIEVSEAVPEEVAGRRLDQQRSLADADRRIATNPGQSRLEVANLDPVAFAVKLGQSGPALALGWNVLALVIADRAVHRRTVTWRLLHATRAADIRIHSLAPTIQSPDHGDGARDRAGRAAAPRHRIRDAAAAIEPAVRAVRGHHPDQTRGHAGRPIVPDPRRLPQDRRAFS